MPCTIYTYILRGGIGQFQGSDVFNLSIFETLPFCFNDVKKTRLQDV